MSTPEKLNPLIVKILKRGARAAELERYAPDVVDATFPSSKYPELSPLERAMKLETCFRESLAKLDDRLAKFFAIVLRFTECVHPRPQFLGHRLEEASQKICYIGAAAVKNKYLNEYVAHLSVALSVVLEERED